MPAVQECPSCEKKIRVPDGAEGRKIRCPGCKELLLIGEDGLEAVSQDAEAVSSKPSKAFGKTSRKPADDDDEDDRPSRKRGRDDDDEEEDEPRSRRGARGKGDDDEEDADEDRPRKKRRKRSAGIPMWVWLAGGGGLAAVAIGVILFVFVLGGSSKFDKVKEGMTEKEVKDLLGKPTFELTFGGNGAAVWTDPPIDEKDLFNAEKTSKVKAALAVEYRNGKVAKKEVKKGSDFGPPGGGSFPRR